MNVNKITFWELDMRCRSNALFRNIFGIISFKYCIRKESMRVNRTRLCLGYLDFVVAWLRTFFGERLVTKRFDSEEKFGRRFFFPRITGFLCSLLSGFISSLWDLTSCFRPDTGQRGFNNSNYLWIISGSENWFILSVVKVFRKTISSLCKVSRYYYIYFIYIFILYV